MSALEASTKILSEGSKMAQTAFEEGTKIAVTYGKPALQSSAELAAEGAQWAAQHPALVVGASIVIVPGLVTAPTLFVLGFGPGGVQACSVGAAAQSAVGNVAAGSLLATLQSAGAGGSGLIAVHSIVQAGATTISIGNAGLSWARARL